MIVKEMLEVAVKELRGASVDEPIRVARILLEFFLKQSREKLFLIEQEGIPKEIEEHLRDAIKKVGNGIPIQYITNNQEFMKLNFYVDENVLIPRCDTEILVEEIIDYQGNKSRILDMCTGSGAIAVSLKKYIENSKVTAVDISFKALEIAKKNAQKNDVKCEFILSDMFEKIKEKYNVIVSNPPYIKSGVISHLDNNVRQEPIIALDGGSDGLMFYKKIVSQAPEYLENEGIVAVEIGYDQMEEVVELFQMDGRYGEVYFKKDLYGNNRIVVAKII